MATSYHRSHPLITTPYYYPSLLPLIITSSHSFKHSTTPSSPPLINTPTLTLHHPLIIPSSLPYSLTLQYSTTIGGCGAKALPGSPRGSGGILQDRSRQGAIAASPPSSHPLTPPHTPSSPLTTLSPPPHPPLATSPPSHPPTHTPSSPLSPPLSLPRPH